MDPWDNSPSGVFVLKLNGFKSNLQKKQNKPHRFSAFLDCKESFPMRIMKPVLKISIIHGWSGENDFYTVFLLRGSFNKLIGKC